MYYAKQVNPEFAESWLIYDHYNKDTHERRVGFYEEFYEENVIIDGNRDFVSITTSEYDNLKRLDNEFYEIEVLLTDNDKHYWNTITDFVNAYLPKTKGKYNTHEIHKWKELFNKYMEHWELEDIAEQALELMTGKKWRSVCICGCSQGDWNNGYVSEEISKEDLRYIEICYFNTGGEYLLYESKKDMKNDNVATSFYIDSYNVKENLCLHIGCKEKDLVVYVFDGYIKTPKYKMI